MIRSCVAQVIFHIYEEVEAGPQDIVFPYLTPKQICLPIALKLPLDIITEDEATVQVTALFAC